MRMYSVFTDVLGNAHGIIHGDTSISRTWIAQEQSYHIYWKEFRVIWHLVHLPNMIGKTIHDISDNTSTIQRINKFGGTPTQEFIEFASSIWGALLSDTYTFGDGMRAVTVQYSGLAIAKGDDTAGMANRQGILSKN
ncbi:hypothetical protein BGZ83_002549 [Gryganskiella cystojenkinii]|nr:hypothetical protein BGZ83_002549 [Gryganskiella cystojenkinii]